MMFKDKYIHKLYAFALAAVFALTLAGCGGGGGSAAAPEPEPTPMPTAYEVAVEAIAAAETEAAARAAVATAVAAGISGTELQDLNTKVGERVEALALMARIDAQKMAMMNAAGMIDTSDLSTQAAINAAEAAIAVLKRAIAAAVDVDDTSMYDAQVTTAESVVDTAQSALDHAAQTMALMNAVDDLQAIDLADLSTKEKIDAAQAAIDALQTALDNATELSAAEKTAAMTELATANRNVMTAQGRYDTAAQKKALADAVATLAALDLDNLMTQAQIDAAVAAITGVNLALEAATNLTDADKLNATVDVTVAQRKVDRAETALAGNIEDQRTALMTAGNALAAIDLADLDTPEKITAANDAVNALEAALDGATHLSDSEKAPFQTQLNTATETVRMAETGMDRDGRRTAQMGRLTSLGTALTTALAALSGTEAPTQEKIDDAETALANLKTAIEEAGDLTDAEKADAERAVAVAEGRIDGAKQARMVADAAKEEEERKAREAAETEMAATAAKLYAGIAAQNGDVANSTAAGTALAAADERGAAYNNVDVPTSGVAVDTRIMVGIGTETPVALSEDKDAPDTDNHGWEGKRYTAEPDDDGTYEARVYSNVGDPTEGAKFNSGSTELPAVGDLNDTTGETPVLSTLTGYAALVDSPSFDQSAGVKEFELPTNTIRYSVSGTYHGVAGTYYCTPAADSTCASRKAAKGFELGSTLDDTNAFTAGGWTFKPTDPEARVTSTPDDAYLSYGWWIHKSADGSTFTASAFVDNKGTVQAAAALDTLQGTATYTGGAAGKYALSSSTGGTNDAGHFTAKATLEADFSDNSITGTIDNFIGADGESRDWSVELKEAAVAATGGISRTDDNDTVWTIGGKAAKASGEWSGTLYDNGADGVPKVGTGTFYSTYDQDGKIVGAFGVNKQ